MKEYLKNKKQKQNLFAMKLEDICFLNHNLWGRAGNNREGQSEGWSCEKGAEKGCWEGVPQSQTTGSEASQPQAQLPPLSFVLLDSASKGS